MKYTRDLNYFKQSYCS